MAHLTRHPHTGEVCQLTNREWRCLKVGINTDSSLWELLAAEQEYKLLLTVATERAFDVPTSEWLCKLIEDWPTDICSSPQALALWYKHLSDLIDIDNYVAQLTKAAELQAMVDKLRVKRHKETVRLVKSMQRDLDRLRKAQALKVKMKRKRKLELARRR